jgi:hypothetical protein
MAALLFGKKIRLKKCAEKGGVVAFGIEKISGRN